MSAVKNGNAPEIDGGNWWTDNNFQDTLVSLLISDVGTLKSCASLLSADDFRIVKGTPNARARWLVAERALDFWNKHHEPLGRLVRSDVFEYARSINLGAAQENELREYLGVLKSIKTTAPGAITEKVINFRGTVLRQLAVEELAELQGSGLLTAEKFAEITRRAEIANISGMSESVNYTATLENRIERRVADRHRARAPWTFIDPLDAMIRTVGRRQLGMILAPYKRGKSLFLLWLAVAMALQRLNVLFITLEDPRDVVEDRLDSIITNVPARALAEKPNTLRKRFQRWKNMISSQIHIYDGTGESVTIERIDAVITGLRDKSFIPDVLIIDYDEKIIASRIFREKRFEIDDIYLGLGKLCSRHYLIGWTAAQTQRDTRHLKILSGDKIAEDIGKIRKVFCAISLGKGDWNDESIYLWVAAHKTQPMERGCTIISDLERSLIYDREATSRARKIHPDDP